MVCIFGDAVLLEYLGTLLMYTNGLTDASSVEITTRDGVAKFVLGM